MEAGVSHERRLVISRPVWEPLLAELHRRTEQVHESGAFLLGDSADNRRQVNRVVYYDDLDPAAYSSGIVVLHADSFSLLWDFCRTKGLSVIADVHVHQEGAWQSEADRLNPMIARSGHFGLIIPWFAKPPVVPETIGLYKYRGNHQWRRLGGRRIRHYLSIEG
jgi:proteasome lid subunit RPN8/RPN11